LYKFETLVPFEVLLLGLDAAIRAPLPMLEKMSNIFNGNAVKGRQRFAGGPWFKFYKLIGPWYFTKLHISYVNRMSITRACAFSQDLLSPSSLRGICGGQIIIGSARGFHSSSLVFSSVYNVVIASIMK